MGRGKANHMTCCSYCTVLRVLKDRGFVLRACRNYNARNIDAFVLYMSRELVCKWIHFHPGLMITDYWSFTCLLMSML